MISIARQKHQKTWRDSTCVSKHLSTDWLLKLTKTSQFISDGLLWSTPNMRCCWNVRLFCINRPLEAAAAVVWGAEHLSGPSSPPKQLCWKHNGQLYHNIYRKTRISDVSSRGDFSGKKRPTRKEALSSARLSVSRVNRKPSGILLSSFSINPCTVYNQLCLEFLPR